MNVVLKRVLTAIVSMGLITTPAMAAGASSPDLSRAASKEAAPAPETVSGAQFGGTGVLVISAIIVLGLAAWALWGKNKKNDNPASP